MDLGVKCFIFWDGCFGEVIGNERVVIDLESGIILVVMLGLNEG